MPPSAPPQIPTVQDVAIAAGVSTATVSRCLNEKQKVSLKTRERVMEAVERLGYTPNFQCSRNGSQTIPYNWRDYSDHGKCDLCTRTSGLSGNVAPIGL